MSSTWLYGLRNTYHESGIDVYEAFSCLRLYVRDLLSAGPSEYVIFMYDSLPPLFFPRHPFFFFQMVRAKRSSTCTPAHARAFTLKFAHLYETSVHTRVYVYTSCKFNGSVHRHWKGLLSFKSFSFSAASKWKEDKFWDLCNCQVWMSRTQPFSFLIGLVFKQHCPIICNLRRAFKIERLWNISILYVLLRDNFT